jgi:HEAT repeat protein
MTKTLTCSLVACACLGAPPALAQVPLPPAVPAAPAAPAAPAPFVDTDMFHVDKEAFKIDVEAFKIDMDAWKADVEAMKEQLKALGSFKTFDFALQTPVPAPPAPPSAIRTNIYVDSRSEDGLYDQARGFIDRDQYTRALDLFDRIIASGGERADDSMYWKAYSQLKIARAQDALATLGELQKRYPKSPWVDDARSLAVEAKQASGQPVGTVENNDEITLLALRGLMQSDPETALPMIEKMLGGNKSVRVKTQALYVVSQSRSPRARDIILNVARSSANPDLKMAAVRSLGQMSTVEGRQALVDIYRTSTDVDVKRAVIRSLQSANAVEELSTLARTEKDPELRRSAIRYLGSSNRSEAVDTLRTIYLGDDTVDTKREIIRALGNNRGAAKVLVDLARQEKNGELKTEMVRVLSNSRDPVARDYLLELLAK